MNVKKGIKLKLLLEALEGLFLMTVIAIPKHLLGS